MKRSGIFLSLMFVFFTGMSQNNERFKINGYVQTQYQINMSSKGDVADQSFRMRRTRLSVGGNLNKRLSYKLQGELVNNPVLLDAYLKVKLCDEISLHLGQFKLPFSLETSINPLNLEMGDYGKLIKKMVGYNDVCGIGKSGRDIGLMISGNFFTIERKKEKFSLVEYNLGVFNGNGINNVDANVQKDIVGRLNVHPMTDEITLSASVYEGVYKTEKTEKYARERFGFGFQYKDDFWTVRAEYITGTTGIYADSLNPDIDWKTTGYYAVAGRWFNFKIKDNEHKIMPFLRCEAFLKGNILLKGGKNFDNSTNESIYSGGVQYWPCRNLQFLVSYSYLNESVKKKSDAKESHQLICMLNYKF